MSGFLSNKYLQFRGLSYNPALGTRPRVVEDDQCCISCGYNLRGLPVGRACPECGEPRKNVPGVNDPLLMGEWSQRKRLWLGLTIITVCLFSVCFARLGIFITLVLALSSSARDLYLWLILLISVGWVSGVWLVTSPEFDARYRRLRPLRIAVRCSQLLWLPACALWVVSILALTGTAQESAHFWSVVLRGLAAVGALGLAVWLMRLAEDAELEDEHRRLNLAVWMLPVPTLVLALIPMQVPWIYLALIFMVLLVWCWFIFQWARAALGMQRHLAWAIRLSTRQQGRDQRMAQVRQQADRQASAMIRPVQTTDSVVPLEPPPRSKPIN
jgi:hypothetical protein